MTLSIKAIKSKLDSKFIHITYEGWVIMYGHTLGRLRKDPYTGKVYLRTNVIASGTNIEYRMKFLSQFRYTQQLCCFNVYFNTFIHVVELHGFRKDM